MMANSRISDLIDFHAHVLPGADHGCGDVDCAKRQLELLSGAGIKKVVATPHFYPHKIALDDFLSLREKCVERIKPILNESTPSVYAAAEVLLVRDLDKMAGLEKLCISGTDVILIELPVTEFDHELENTLLNIRESGLRPVVAHIDRYERSVRARLFEMGVACQINVSSMASFLKRRDIMPSVKNGSVFAIGSDIHGTGERFAELYEKACKQLDGKLEAIMKRSAYLLKDAVNII